MTKKDLRIVAAFYPILIELAGRRALMTYLELANEAKARHPDDPLIKTLIPRSVSRRLSILRTFTDETCHPDLSCLIVNTSTGEVGKAYSDTYDPLEQRVRVFAYDWSSVAPSFQSFLEDKLDVSDATKPVKLKRDAAKRALWDYAKTNDIVPVPNGDQVEIMVRRIMTGEEIASAIASVMNV
jgi:hypothetical protein